MKTTAYKLSLLNRSWPREVVESVKPWGAVLALIMLLGLVGHMDHQDAKSAHEAQLQRAAEREHQAELARKAHEKARAELLAARPKMYYLIEARDAQEARMKLADAAGRIDAERMK